jgi:uncharacterized protein YcbK (DUF882 family)
MKLTENFSLDEFKSKDGSAFPAEVVQNLSTLAVQLQALRDEVKKPITITSGYRSKEHNLKIGGALDSYHVRGMASDIQVSGMTPKQVYDTIEKLIKESKMMEGGLGLYKSWVHYDFRNKKIRWKK